MSDSPAPRSPDDDVPAPLRLRASDADRDRVAKVINNAFAEGRLTPVEHEERLAEVYAATTYAELVPTLRDLPVPPGTLTVPNSSSPVALPNVDAEATAGTGVSVRPGQPLDTGTTAAAVFGEFARTGPWTVPDQMSAVAVFGSGELDFTQTTLTSNETVINVVAIFGEVKLTVPPGMGVRNEVVAVMGEADVRVEAGSAEVPTLVLKGAVIFGSLQVRHPKPPKKSKRRQITDR